MHEKYGSVVTSQEMMTLDMLEAQRRTNELLEKMFVLQQKPMQTVTNPTGAKPSAEEKAAPKAPEKAESK